MDTTQQPTRPKVFTYSQKPEKEWLKAWRAAGFEPRTLDHERDKPIGWFERVKHLLPADSLLTTNPFTRKLEPFIYATSLPRWHAMAMKVDNNFAIFTRPNIVPGDDFRIDVRHLRHMPNKLVCLHQLSAVLGSFESFNRWLNLIASTPASVVEGTDWMFLDNVLYKHTLQQFPDFFVNEPAKLTTLPALCSQSMTSPPSSPAPTTEPSSS
jgi:hypothetical protein